MWKRLLIIFISLVGVFSVVYVKHIQETNVELSANTTTYMAGGNVTGRVNQAPNNINHETFEFKKGDKILMGTLNPNTGQTTYKNMVWMLINQETYTDYGCLDKTKVCVASEPLTSWYSLSYDSIGKYSMGLTKEDFKNYSEIDKVWIPNFEDTNLYSPLVTLTNSVIGNAGDNKILSYMNLGPIHTTEDYSSKEWTNMLYNNFFNTVLSDRALFPINDVKLAMGAKEFTFFDSYWGMNTWNNDDGRLYSNHYINSKGEQTPYKDPSHQNNAINGTVLELRPSSYLDLSKVVFAISKGSTSGFSTIESPVLNEIYSSLYDEAQGNPMKVRIENEDLTNSTSFLGIENDKGIQITSVVKDSTVNLVADAIEFTSDSGIKSTISVLVFDGGDNKFLYYMPLEYAKGNSSNKYKFDTTGLPIGTYKIGIVNEVYNDSDMSPTESSAITNVYDLEIVEPMSDLIITKASNTYTYESNHTKAGSNIATASSVNHGVAPYTYSLIKDDTVSDHDNDINLFEIGTDGNIIAKEDLNAGKYYFKVRVTDANGATIDSSQILIDVKKATPTISFDSGTTTKNMAYVSGETWQETITHTNTDNGDHVSFTSDHPELLSAVRNSDKQVTLQINNQDKKGTVSITATLNETTNFTSVSATKTVFIYDDISDFTFTPVKDLITAKDTETIGYHIGTLSFKDGLSPFVYSVSSEDTPENVDRNKFKVETQTGTDANSMKVLTTQKLGAGTYKVTFKVANQYQSKSVNAIITVSLADQTTFAFYDYEDDSLIQEGGTKEIKYQTPNAKVIAKDGESDGKITYQIKDGEDTSILKVDSETGILTMYKTGTIIIQATKAGNALYDAKTIEMSIKVINGAQKIAFNTPFPTNQKFVKDEIVNIPATLTRDNKTTGSITYQVDPLSASICTIEDESSAKVKLLATGACTIIAKNQDAYYEEVSDTKSINVYAPVSGKIIQVQDYFQGDDALQANSGTVLAKVSNLAGGGNSYTFESITVKKDDVEVTDALAVNNAWEITPLKTLTYGKYHISVVIKDAYGDTGTVSGNLIIGLESNNAFVITKDGSIVTTPLVYEYHTVKDGFQLETQGKKGTGTVVFTESGTTKKDSTEAKPAIEIRSDGFVSVNRAMKAGEQYDVYAYVEADSIGGYGRQETESVNIIIKKSEQEIQFVDTIPTHQMFQKDQVIPINAKTIRDDGTNGTIKYAVMSASTGICEIKDETIAEVTMLTKGSCIIQASNEDANYKQASINTTIELYEGIKGTLVQTGDYHQGEAAVLAGSDVVLAEVTSLSGGGGANNYLFTEIETVGYANTKFNIAQNGDITAKETLKSGTYNVILTVKDGYGGSSNITGTITILAEENTAFELVYKDGTKITNDIITIDYITAATTGIKLDTIGKKGTGAVQFYITDDSSKDTTKTEEALRFNDDRSFTGGILYANRAMTQADTYKAIGIVEADSTLGLAEQKTQTVTIVITPSAQTIAFKDEVPESKKFQEQGTIDITAETQRQDQSKGKITYSVANESSTVCEIKDQSVPEVTMLTVGSCIVRAENDGDGNFTSKAELKEITLYDAMSAKFRVLINNLKQNDEALDPKSNTVIAKIVNIVGSQGTIQYSLSVKKGSIDLTNSGYFTINDQGEIRPAKEIGYGTYDVVVTLMDDHGEDGKIEIPGKIVVGLEENKEFHLMYENAIVLDTIEETYANPLELQVETTGKKGSGKVYYEIVNETQALDPNLVDAVTIDEDGFISVHRVTKKDEVYKVFAYVKEDLQKGYAKQVSESVSVVIKEASMSQLYWMVNGKSSNHVEDTYKKDKSIQLGIGGLPANAKVKYYLDADDQGMKNGILVNDVVRINETTGKLTILHANTTEQLSHVIIKAVVTCTGYEDKAMTGITVQINKAEQSDFAFAQATYPVANGTGSLSPEFIGGVVHDDGVSNNIVLRCDEAYNVSIDPDDERTLHYEVNDPDGADITIKAKNLGNRDFKPKEASAILKVLGAQEDAFDVEVSPGRVITYGDDITITPRDTKDGITYEYSSELPEILEQDEHEPQKFHANSIGTVQIKVIKHEAGKQDATAFVNMIVNPKKVQVELKESYKIKTGEPLPDFALKPFEDGAIIHGDVIEAPVISVDLRDTLTLGVYPIYVAFADHDVNRNYTFVYKEAALTITQDQAKAQWLKAYLASDDTKTQKDLTKWYRETLMIESIHTAYDELSLNAASWSKTQTLNKEGRNTVQVYLKDHNTGAITSAYELTYQLDFTGPQITEIHAEDTNTSTFASFMNTITFQTYYKPGVELTIKAEDVPNKTEKSSGVKKITYQVYSLTHGQIDTLIKEDHVSSSIAQTTLSDVGEYRVCAVSEDVAGNPGTETCQDINVKRIDIDVDQDGLPDLNDSDLDGCPDLNIKWYDAEGTLQIINGDRDYDGLPDLNIDADGDGVSDLNIDTDHDGLPDLNLVDFTKQSTNLWTPSKCVLKNETKGIMETYCTGTGAKAELNVDLNNDGIPDINIITDLSYNEGNWKPELNITKEGSTEPYLNIAKINVWKPENNGSFDEFSYDTMNIKPIYNIDTSFSGYPDLNIDLDQDGIADINIDVDGDGIPDTNIDTTGDGKADLNIDNDLDGVPDEAIYKLNEWTPNKHIEGTIEYDTMELVKQDQLEDQGIVIAKPDGTFLPNFAIKVTDITDREKDSISEIAKDQIREDQEVKVVYDVTLFKDEMVTQPDGTVSVRIPIPEGMNHPKLLMKNEQGEYVLVDALIEDGYFVYDTTYLGIVAIIDDVAEHEPIPKEEPVNTSDAQTDKTKSDVQGEYHLGANMGGVRSGDETSLSFYTILFCSTFLCLGFLIKKRKMK